jgi:hypothetical protein
VKQLGRYLLEHNPNGPRVHLPGQAPPDASDATEDGARALRAAEAKQEVSH